MKFYHCEPIQISPSRVRDFWKFSEWKFPPLKKVILTPPLLPRTNHCGIFDVPAGIMPLSRLACVAIHMGFGFLASDGTIILPEKTRSSEVVQLIQYYWPALEKSGYRLTVKDGNSSHTISNELLEEFAYKGLSCYLDTEYVEEPDGDYYKHGIHHLRFMLL